MCRTNPKNSTDIAILHNNFGPYHLSRLDATARLGKAKGLEVVGLELAARENIHPWDLDAISPEVKKYTVFPHKAIEEVKSLTLVTGTWSMLTKLSPKAMALSLDKQTFPALLTVLAWAKLHARVVILMMDSKYDDQPRQSWKEWAKRRVMSLFDGGIVAGIHSKAYAEFLGIPPKRIFVGYDVVDNDYFSHQAEAVRENAPHLRKKYSLPENYFLAMGRFDAKKNFLRLLEAYSHYRQDYDDEAWGLVICGAGPLEYEIKLKANQLNLHQVQFPGFAQITDLPIYYGLARCFIMPSLGDTWGLVINEAMASGLPVLVSRACGCTPDLVQEGVNGYTLDPYDTGVLAQLMRKMSSGDLDLKAMGEASRTIIAGFSLETFAQNLFKAVEAGSTLHTR
jgi:glycosyltransferase involved in cell wall biosynthesis